MAARKLDRRTIALSALIAAVIAGLAAVLAYSVLADDTETAASSSTSEVQLEHAGDEPLSVPLETVDGAATTLDDLVDGRPMLINLWQSSCTPCVKEMPLLDAASVDNPEVSFIGVATQDKTSQAEDLAEQTGITYPWVLDPKGDLYYATESTGMPTTILMDPQGNVLASKVGAFDDAEELQAFLDDHVG